MSEPLEWPEFGSDATIRLSLRILAAYLIVVSWPLLRWSLSMHSAGPFAIHIAALGVALALSAPRVGAPQWLRDWTPLALGPFLYVELRWIIEGAGRPHADALVARWEVHLFGFDPSSALAVRWPSLALSEFLHLCYISYYAIVYVPPALLWLRGKRAEFAATILALVVAYALCFASYVVFPVDGPRYLFGPAAAPEGIIRAFVLQVLESGSSRGTAFPSSHVAASVVASICALRFQRPIGVLVAILTAGVAIGAVYGGFHYGIDIIAGVIVALAAAALALRRAKAPLSC